VCYTSSSPLLCVLTSPPRRRVKLVEDQSQGQLIHYYTVRAVVNGSLTVISVGTSVGAGKIDVFPGVVATSVSVVVAPGNNGLTMTVFNC
jgi:hypothetical protein